MRAVAMMLLCTFALLGAIPRFAKAETVTRLTVSGPPGEYVSGGTTHVLAPPDSFRVRRNGHGGVSVTAISGETWQLDFSAPFGAPLQPGVYVAAQLFPNEDGHPGLSVIGDGRACLAITGAFTVKAVTYDITGAVTSFWATGQQQCTPSDVIDNPLQFEVYWHMDSSTPARPVSWGGIKSMYR